jgi:hypothetical protein
LSTASWLVLILNIPEREAQVCLVPQLLRFSEIVLVVKDHGCLLLVFAMKQRGDKPSKNTL